MDVRPATEVAKIRPHPYAAEFPELTAEERKLLEQSIDQHGFDPMQPVIVGTLVNRKTPFIVDGIQRVDVAASQGKTVQVFTRIYADEEDVVAHIFKLNVARRHMKTKDRIAMAKRAVELGGISVRKAAKEANVGEASVRRALSEEDATAPNDAVAPKRRGADNKERPAKRKTAAEQRVWDIEADHLAQTLGSNKAAAERLGVAPRTITNARKRAAGYADETPTPRLPRTQKEDQQLRMLSSAWKRFTAASDPEAQFKAAFLDGVRAAGTASPTAWVQAFVDWEKRDNPNQEGTP